MTDHSLGIKTGGVYVYSSDQDSTYKGHEYLVVALAKDVPVYSTVVVTVGLTGPDEGKHYVCTPSYFLTRFSEVNDGEGTAGTRVRGGGSVEVVSSGERGDQEAGEGGSVTVP